MRKSGERTKIVCTIGPASSNVKTIDLLIKAGMDVARLNFSHGTHKEHQNVLSLIRSRAEKAGRNVAILQDLSGPKVRIGEVKQGCCLLRKGSIIVLTTDTVPGTPDRLSINYPKLPQEVKPGNNIYLNDGALKLRVSSVKDSDIICKVIVGGSISSSKGVNLPDTNMSLPSLTRKDIKDLAFGLSTGIDMVALSFVRKPEDIIALKKVMEKQNRSVPIIAKIEKREALRNINSIVQTADAIMVARGDLGIEISIAELPLAQKRIISAANALGKPVITATQMLESMISNPRPTRAEATDVANAILDGTDAVMLSAETAIGKYPVEAVRIMAKISRRLERSLTPPKGTLIVGERKNEVADAICRAVSVMAMDLKVRAIVPCTASGSTARMIARYRPKAPIYAVSPFESTVRQLALSWGVTAFKVKRYKDADDMVKTTCDILKKNRLVKIGDRIILIAGVPVGTEGTTNFLEVITVKSR